MGGDSNNKSKILIGIIVALAALVFVAAYFIFDQKTQIVEMQEDSVLTKQQLEDEYEHLAVQYEGFKLNLKNDSLLHKLGNEQAKVQRLLEELKTVKSENKKEISRLSNELQSLRKILKQYVAQIDSLNRLNEKLRKENKEISAKYQATARSLTQVSKEKTNLTEQVSMAAKLDAVAINIAMVNKKGKAQKKLKSVERLIVSFTIGRNITAQPGERTIYVRIMKPDDDVLVKSRTHLFGFENRDINYSMQRVIEYGGEEVGVELYWEVEEYLMPGTYRVDVFADGSRIGSKSLTMSN